MMKHSFLLLIVLLLPLALWGQQVSSKERPSWVDGYFDDLGNSYIKMTSASAFSEAEAFDKAVAQVIEARSQESGMRVNVHVEGDGRITVKGSDNVTVKARVIDQYVEFVSGQYRVSVLAQVAKHPQYNFEQVKVTNEYGFSPSVFVPGMAQIQKGSKGKGAFFIGAEVAFIGGIVVAECLRSSNASKVNSTHNVADRKVYADNADVCANVRNVAIAGAAAIYVWNIIDGIAAKGKKHIVVADNKILDIRPYASFDGGGLALSFTF